MPLLVECQYGNNAYVTVTFNEKLSGVQFRLNFDSDKFDFVKVSSGTYIPSTKMYVYLNEADIADLGNVTFTFKSKKMGTGSFSVGEAELSSSTVTMKTTKVNVSVVAKSSTSTTKPTNSAPVNNTVPDQNTVTQQPITMSKPELQRLKADLAKKIQTDYTVDSWKALQDLILKAENVASEEEYDAIKKDLKSDSLVVAEFEKTELFAVLKELVGKVQGQYTDDSWNALQDVIDEAQSAKLKSEYDAVKDELTTDTLVKKTGLDGFLSSFSDGLAAGDPACVMGLFGVMIMAILVIVIVVMSKNNSRRRYGEEFTRR